MRPAAFRPWRIQWESGIDGEAIAGIAVFH